MVRAIPLVVGLLLTAPVANTDGLGPDRPSQIVMLRPGIHPSSICGTGTPLDRQVLPDGDEVPFTIPPGRVLVLTGVTWVIGSANPNSSFGVAVSLHFPSGHSTPLFRTGAVTDADGVAFGSALIPNAVAASGPALCYATTATGDVSVYGYLTDDK